MEHNNYEQMTVPTLKIWRERGESHVTLDLENLS